jgi:uncharacterized membrane protein (UPF0127 family)
MVSGRFNCLSRLCRAFTAFAVVCLIVGLGYAHAKTIEQVEIVTKTGVKVFEVEIATNDQEREKGLMYRKSVPEGTGMLFDFGDEREVVMWMKNTPVSLDMIFIYANGTVANIAENTTPFSEARIYSGPPVKAVLEVVAGTARKYDIAVGDKVSHRFFNGR